MTRKLYATLRHPKMHPHTKFGIPAFMNIEDMHRTQSRTDERTDYMPPGIKTTCTCIPMKQHKSKKVMFIFSLHIHILSERVCVIVVKFIGGIMFTL